MLLDEVKGHSVTLIFFCVLSYLSATRPCGLLFILACFEVEKSMASKMDNFQISLLKQFVDLCKQKPDLIHTPQLKFFKDWLER